MGMVSCFGTDPDRFYDRLLAGESGVKPITKIPVDDMPTRFGAFVSDFDPDGYVDKKQQRRADPFVTYALYSGLRALEDAGLTKEVLETVDRTRCGCVVGSGMGGMGMYYQGVTMLEEMGVRRVSPFFVPYIITNMAAGLLATEAGFQGPNYSISTACATATHSVVAAANHIRAGDADIMLCGGVEATQLRISMAGFVACRALSTRNDDPQGASRPWDKTRDGFVMGEGCGVFVLESLESALARGAPIYAEYLGGGMSCDAYHMTNIRPDGSGITLCINNMLRNAEIEPERVNYINAHATSTPLGDMAEVAGIKGAFGDHTKNIKVNATKSLIGHCLGGAGAIEMVTTLQALRRKKLHPTINLRDPEDDLDLDIVRDEAQDHDIDVAVSNSFGFGGHNACLALSNYSG